MVHGNLTRTKLETVDNNHIDSVFIDNRAVDENGKPAEGPGQTLVGISNTAQSLSTY